MPILECNINTIYTLVIIYKGGLANQQRLRFADHATVLTVNTDTYIPKSHNLRTPLSLISKFSGLISWDEKKT